MSFSVRVRQLPQVLEVEPGQTILDAAQAAGLDYPCGCQSGNCGACKSVLISGDVSMSGYSDFALSLEERASGKILACCAVPTADCDLAWEEPDEVANFPRKAHAGRVAELDRLTHDITRIRVALTDGTAFAFAPGQYASVRFEGLPPRDFSMANQPKDPYVEFHIRHLDKGQVSAFVGAGLKVGAPVTIDGPMGTAFLREGHKGPIFACAGGSGLAPIKSIVERALRLGLAQPIHLYFGVRDERDLYMEGHFRALAEKHANFRFEPVLSEPAGPTHRRSGVLAEVLAKDLPRLDYAKAYLAGPPVMVETCVEALNKKGLERRDCHADAFYTEAERAANQART